MPMEIVCWQPLLTDHQSYTFEALSRLVDGRLKVNVCRTEDATREAQGWVARHKLASPPHVVPARGGLTWIIRHLRSHRDSVHLFGSPFEQPRIIVALMLALLFRLRVFLISEPYSVVSEGYLDDDRPLRAALKTRLRPLVYRLYGLLIRRRLSGVFAISPLSAAQYRRLGIPADRIKPFGYFVPRDEALVTSAPGEDTRAMPANGALRLVFVGALIRRKGLDVLTDAVRRLRDQGIDATLDVYGAGDPSHLYPAEGVCYRGLIPFGEAQRTIARYDVLVLPSRYDGWGVVVNEALLAGVPVVCSDRVGAATVVERYGCGSVFRTEDAGDLSARLAAFADTHRLGQAREAARRAADAIDPAVAAHYMFDVLTGASMTSPW